MSSLHLCEANLINRSSKNELLFACYCHLFVMVKPLSLISPSLVSAGLYIGTIVIILLCLYHNSFKLNITTMAPSLLFIAAIFCFFCGTLFINNNYQLSIDIKLFCMNAIVPWLLLSYVKDWRALLKHWTTLGAFSGIVPLIDTFVGNVMFEDYMVLGYEGLLPAFACCLVNWLYYKKRKYIFAVIIYLTDMVIYANKGAALTAIILLAVMYIYFSNNRRNTAIKLSAIVISGVAVYLFRKPLLAMLFELARKIGVNSYSLNTLSMIVYGDGELVFGLRTDLWEDAIRYILQNPIMGYGAGGFYTLYGNYPHNIFLELCLTFGCVIGLLLIVILLRGIVFTAKEKNIDRQSFLTTMLILWLVPLSISMSFWQSSPFWIFLGSTFLYNKKR